MYFEISPQYNAGKARRCETWRHRSRGRVVQWERLVYQRGDPEWWGLEGHLTKGVSRFFWMLFYSKHFWQTNMYSIVFSFRKKEGQEQLTCITCSQQILETFRSQCKNSCRDATPGNEETVWSFDVMYNGNHHSKIKPRQVDVEARWGSIGSCFVVGIWYFFSWVGSYFDV